ncbi:ephrin-A4 [Silurus meridionalis]|nr:ephrin-A4 [Silurus meridionalis]
MPMLDGWMHGGEDEEEKKALGAREGKEGGRRAEDERTAFGLTSDDYSVQVNLNDYLDILCPHYSSRSPEQGPPEYLALYLVAEHQFRGCHETEGAIKRWECNSPYAPYGPVRFSEKIQRFTPFSLGFEFLPGHHYYYSSLSVDDKPPLPCMKLKVTVCCESKNPSWAYGLELPGRAWKCDMGGSPVCPDLECSVWCGMKSHPVDLRLKCSMAWEAALSASGSSMGCA